MTIHDIEINKNKIINVILLSFFKKKNTIEEQITKNPPPHLNQTLSSMDAKGDLE